jgi:glycosyltransferase involved in cell wall biosynthesis
MRILHVIDSFSPATGGPPEAVRQLVKASRAAGASVEVVCLDDPRAGFLGGLGCPVHALGQSYLGRYAFSPRLWRWLRANAARFDGMVMHGAWTFPGSALRWAARGAGKPYGVFVHGALDPWFNRQYPLKHLKKRLYWPEQYAVLRNAAAVFFTTAAERDQAQTSFRPNRWKSVVAPLGIVEEQDCACDSAAQIAEFYRALPALGGRRFLLFLARLHEKKGCDLLVEAFARAAAAQPELDLVMAGPDSAGIEAKLRERAEELGIAARVHWPGMIGGGVKWGALRACDALVLPSHQENFGVSVVEALCAGRPVLLSRQVNLWPEIENDGAGMAEEDTLAGTVRLLERWFALSAAGQAAMAARAQPCFAARFSMARTAALMNAVFGAG